MGVQEKDACVLSWGSEGRGHPRANNHLCVVETPQEGVLFKVSSSSGNGPPKPARHWLLSQLPPARTPATRRTAVPPEPSAPRPRSAPTPSHAHSSLPAPLPDSCPATTKQRQLPRPTLPQIASRGRRRPRPAGSRAWALEGFVQSPLPLSVLGSPPRQLGAPLPKLLAVLGSHCSGPGKAF